LKTPDLAIDVDLLAAEARMEQLFDTRGPSAAIGYRAVRILPAWTRRILRQSWAHLVKIGSTRSILASRTSPMRHCPARRLSKILH
jgi:hypothetical protein